MDTSAQAPAANGVETRERILVEASRLFALGGYHGTTTREIAAAVGISQPSLFFHFPTKKAILEELSRLDLVPAVERMENLLVVPGTAGAKLFAMIIGELNCILGSPYDLRAHLGYEVLNDPDLATYRDLAHRFDDLVRLIIRTGQEAGEFIDIDAAIAQQLVTAMLLRAPLFDREIPASLKDIEPEASATLILRSLLVDVNDLEPIREAAHELVSRYCSG
jgi:AcrR family transcriptional regulator